MLALESLDSTVTSPAPLTVIVAGVDVAPVVPVAPVEVLSAWAAAIDPDTTPAKQAATASAALVRNMSFSLRSR
jgi:hypothetical protein